MCDHKYVYKGLHCKGEETHSTSVPWKTLYDVYFCERCLDEKKVTITSGYHIEVPENTVRSGYGNNY